MKMSIQARGLIEYGELTYVTQKRQKTSKIVWNTTRERRAINLYGRAEECERCKTHIAAHPSLLGSSYFVFNLN